MYSVSLFDSGRAASAQDAVVDIYRAVYEPPPYNEPEERVLAFAAAWSQTTATEGFTFCFEFTNAMAGRF